MKLEKYIIYIDNGDGIIEEAIPATNQFVAECEVSGKGKIVKVKNVTDTIHISSEHVAEALRRYGHFTQTESEFIINTLKVAGIAEQARKPLTFIRNDGGAIKISDYIIATLAENNIDWYYNKYPDMFADFYGTGEYMRVMYTKRKLEGIEYEIIPDIKLAEGKVIHNGHTYYTYRRYWEHNGLYECSIKDDENGTRGSYITGEKSTPQKIFDYLYENSDSFKEYVDTDGKCLEG